MKVNQRINMQVKNPIGKNHPPSLDEKLDHQTTNLQVKKQTMKNHQHKKRQNRKYKK
jgi:hypothetical protein